MTVAAGPALADRPLVSTPRRLLSREFVDAERERLSRQPGLGLAGILLVTPVAVFLAVGMGGLEPSLLVLGPISTFALPIVSMIAFWWENWPGSRLRPGWSGLVDTLLVIVGAVLLTILGQAIVSHADLRGIFDPTPGPGHPASFPATMPLAAATFVAMLQVTLVCEGWPLRRLRPLPSGVAALVVAWAIAVAAYLLLRDHLTGASMGAWLVSLGIWQVAIYVVLRGWPFANLRRRWVRLAGGNILVIGGGWLTYLFLRHSLGWATGTVSAVAGSLIAAGLVVGMLFEGWPAALLTPLPGRLLKFAGIVALGMGLYFLLKAAADGIDWTRAESEGWVAYVGLNAIGGGVILHVAIGRRWPFAKSELE